MIIHLEITTNDQFLYLPFLCIAILPEPNPENEVVLALNVTTTMPACMQIAYIFDTTLPKGNYITLENCQGNTIWKATYGNPQNDYVDIPGGLSDPVFRMRTVGPYVGIRYISVTEGPCRKGKRAAIIVLQSIVNAIMSMASHHGHNIFAI